MFLSRIRKENLSNLTYISPSVLWRPTTASLLQSYPLIISFPPHNYRQCRPSFLNPTAYFSHLNYITLTSKNHQQIVNIHPYSHPNPHQKYLKTNTFRANFQQHTKPFNPIFEPSPTHSIRFQSKNPSRNPLKTPKPVDFDGL